MKIYLNTICCAIVASLGIVFGIGSASYAVEAEGMKIMSFNVRYGSADDKENSWELRKETLVEVIKENAPVALGVQEALVDQVNYIKDSLDGYDAIGVGRDDGKEKGEFMSIFYKKDELELLDSGTFWLSETPEEPSLGWDARCKRVVTWGRFRCKKTDKTFVYANTHLDHVGKVARQKGAELILSRIESMGGVDSPFILSGDFNVTEEWEAYKTIVAGLDGQKGLIDTNKVAKVREIAQEYTAHAFGRITAPNAKIIDFIFVNDKFDVEKFKINPVKHTNGRYASDHSSIVATLSFK